MEPVIRAKNLEVSDGTRGYIIRKLERLNRRLNNIGEAKVELVREETRSQQDRIVVQMTLNCNGTVVRGQERGSTINAAVDAVADILDRRIRRLRSKLYKSEQTRKSGRATSIREMEAPEPPDAEGEEDLLEDQEVMRVKRFAMKPRSVEEAANEMELLGHDFFFFFNIATGEYNVLYHRVNGGYGLLEPELM
ncbi:MAG: ribosome-associated translation inhibitor RaiA [Chloroflexi bacterium]|nr:ribosome-associated translation inhibitor RaiA [Chloroflexota bacterium]